MPVTRDKLAEQVVEYGNFTVEDFVGMCDMHPSPQGASQKLKDAIAQTVESATRVQLFALISQHETMDILDNVPSEFKDKSGSDGPSALRALGISSLTRAVFDLVVLDDAYDPREILVLDDVVSPSTEIAHATQLG